MRLRMNIPKNPRLMVKQAGAMGTIAKQFKRVGQYGKELVAPGGKFNPIKGVANQAKKGYRMTATATSPDKQKRLISDTLENALQGKASNFATTQNPNKKGIIQSLRNRGWLSAGGKTTGNYSPEQIAQIKKIMGKKGLMRDTSKSSFLGKMNSPVNEKANVKSMQEALKEIQAINPANKASKLQRVGDYAYAALPGEKSILVGGAGMGMAGEMATKETASGRKKSLAERAARAGTIGVAEAALAPLGLARKFGLAGMATEAAGAEGTYRGLEALGNAGAKMKKQAGSFDDLSFAQRAIVSNDFYSRPQLGRVPKKDRVSLKDSFNPMKLRQNYRKRKKFLQDSLDEKASSMFPKSASVPTHPRSALRRVLK
jgi:hypothetical protein